MANRALRLLVVAFSFFSCILVASAPAQNSGKRWRAVVPRVWDDEAMRSLEVPLADPGASPKPVSSEYYYRMPVRPIHKSYPVYHPDKEPSGSVAWLKKQGPQIVFDASKLKTERNWVAAGELVFDAPIEFESSGILFSVVRDPAWYKTNRSFRGRSQGFDCIPKDALSRVRTVKFGESASLRSSSPENVRERPAQAANNYHTFQTIGIVASRTDRRRNP